MTVQCRMTVYKSDFVQNGLDQRAIFNSTTTGWKEKGVRKKRRWVSVVARCRIQRHSLPWIGAVAEAVVFRPFHRVRNDAHLKGAAGHRLRRRLLDLGDVYGDRAVRARRIGYHPAAMIAALPMDGDPGRTAIAKVDAIVEAHQERVRIMGTPYYNVRRGTEGWVTLTYGAGHIEKESRQCHASLTRSETNAGYGIARAHVLVRAFAVPQR
ncbi:hypothetical protein BC827DRAFT_1158640 [Russula dissimulans]|nr:hypothetical protein BC827DRAFT_1159112 [Russula dissimulans]KAH9954685.1 hypothetical protein BC827DRAFT_1158640 [Russula dissimulans]